MTEQQPAQPSSHNADDKFFAGSVLLPPYQGQSSTQAQMSLMWLPHRLSATYALVLPGLHVQSQVATSNAHSLSSQQLKLILHK